MSEDPPDLFSHAGIVLEAEPRPAKPKRGRRPKPPTPAERAVAVRLVALPLALNCRLVGKLASRFWASPPGPNRVSTFRRKVLLPLVSARVAVGLGPQHVETEVYSLEDAIVNCLLERQEQDGSGGRAA